MKYYYLDNGTWDYLLVDTERENDPLYLMDEDNVLAAKASYEEAGLLEAWDGDILEYIAGNLDDFDFVEVSRFNLADLLRDRPASRDKLKPAAL